MWRGAVVASCDPDLLNSTASTAEKQKFSSEARSSKQSESFNYFCLINMFWSIMLLQFHDED